MGCSPIGEMRLELHYASAVRDRVHQLVRQEAECCAFLGFTVNESADRVTLTITVPERAGEIAGDLLAPFWRSAMPKASNKRDAAHPAAPDAASKTRSIRILNETIRAERYDDHEQGRFDRRSDDGSREGSVHNSRCVVRGSSRTTEISANALKTGLPLI